MGTAKVTIGKLRHRITIQKLDKTSDGQGGFTEAWTDLIDLWSELIPTKAWERFYSEQIQMLTSHRVTIRYIVPTVPVLDEDDQPVLDEDDIPVVTPTPITSEMRIKYGTRVFQIKGVRYDAERKFWMILDANENEGS